MNFLSILFLLSITFPLFKFHCCAVIWNYPSREFHSQSSPSTTAHFYSPSDHWQHDPGLCDILSIYLEPLHFLKIPHISEVWSHHPGTIQLYCLNGTQNYVASLSHIETLSPQVLATAMCNYLMYSHYPSVYYITGQIQFYGAVRSIYKKFQHLMRKDQTHNI